MNYDPVNSPDNAFFSKPQSFGTEKKAGATGDAFDRTVRSLKGLPGVVEARPATVTDVSPLTNVVSTFIVQTYRQAESGDTIFVQGISAEGSFRIALPPAVSEAIARQRDSLATKNRRRGASQAIETRKARGEDPVEAMRRVRALRRKK